MVNFKAIKDAILFRPLASATSKSGLMIPLSGGHTSNIGKVISVGGEVKSVKVGDYLVVNSYQCPLYYDEGKTYNIYREADVLGILEGLEVDETQTFDADNNKPKIATLK